MELLLPIFVSSNATLQYLQLEILAYLDGVKSAVLISDEPEFYDFNFPFPLSRMNLDLMDSSNPLSSTPEAYIMDLRNEWSVKKLGNIRRDVHTKVLVITSLDMESSAAFSELSFCTAHYLLLTEDNVTVLDKSDTCKGIGGASPIGCYLSVSFMDLPPRINFNGGKLSGAEGLLIQTSAEILGIELIYVNRHDTEWGQFDPPEGMLGDVITGKSIVGIGSLYPTLERYHTVDTMTCWKPVNLAWAVPTAAGPGVATWFVVLVSELSLTVWIGLGLGYVVAVLAAMSVSQFIKRRQSKVLQWKKKHGKVETKQWLRRTDQKSKDMRQKRIDRSEIGTDTSMALHLLALIIGMPQQQLLPRRFSIVVVFFGFIMVSCYVSQMSSILTSPQAIADIATLKQLVDTNLLLLAPPLSLNLFAIFAKFLPDDHVRVEMSRRAEAYHGGLSEVLPRIAVQRDAAYFRHGENLAHHAEKDPLTAGKIHIVEESLEIFFPVYLAPKHSCLTPKFQQAMLKICQSGLVEKWARDFASRPHQESTRGPRVLTLEHATGFMYLIAFGWSIAFALFLLEKAVYFLSERKISFRERAPKTVALRLIFVQGVLPVTGEGFIAFFKQS